MTNAARIIVPASSIDSLTFDLSPKFRPDDDDTWIARYPHQSGWDKEYYRVYQWKDYWAASRPKHPILGEFEVSAADRSSAMVLCADDFAKVERLRRWTEHMVNNEPPT